MSNRSPCRTISPWLATTMAAGLLWHSQAPAQSPPLNPPPAQPVKHSGLPNNSGYAPMPALGGGAGRDRAKLFAALGLSMREGHLDWPLGLRILPPARETAELRDQVDAAVQLLAGQMESGRMDPRLLKSAAAGVTHLRILLRGRGTTLGETTFLNAERFLTKVERAVLKMAPPPSRGSSAP